MHQCTLLTLSYDVETIYQINSLLFYCSAGLSNNVLQHFKKLSDLLKFSVWVTSFISHANRSCREDDLITTNNWLALLLRDIIRPQNKSERPPMAIISLVVGPKDPRDTSESLGMPTGSKKALGVHPDYHVLFI